MSIYISTIFEDLYVRIGNGRLKFYSVETDTWVSVVFLADPTKCNYKLIYKS